MALSRSLVRSRWTISRVGLQAIFGTPPVILNDVAARAWATRSGTANIEPLRGVGMPSLSRPGRYGMVMVEEGVGAAIVDVDRDAGVRVLETEAGHMDFSPASEREERLAKAVRGSRPVVCHLDAIPSPTAGLGDNEFFHLLNPTPARPPSILRSRESASAPNPGAI